jgi:hypothetical protein
MKATMLLFCLVGGLLVATTSFLVAQHLPVAAGIDTITIAGGAGNEGNLEATINGDTTAAGARVNTHRVYKLTKNTIYTQYSAIDIKNPTGTLIIVGEKGGTKPVIVLTDIGGIRPGQNLVQGSIKLDNIHMQGMVTDGFYNTNLWIGSTANGLPQSVDVNDCLFEFIQLDTFSCDAYTGGAKFRFTNSYFQGQWWGGRVFYCKRAIDTIWVENCTVTGGGLIFLQQSSMCKFAYYNHNTIINSNKYWQLGVYYLEGYWTNNLFINQNWVGEDYENVATGGQDPDRGMLMGNFGLDTLTVQNGTPTTHINVQAEYLLADGTIDPAKCGLDKIKAFVSNNIMWTDTVMLEAYYKNKAVGGYGPYGTSFVGECPVSMTDWYGTIPGPPYKVRNVPGIWMNPRTASLFSGTYPKIVQKDNYINVKVETVTLAIKDAAVANQMALWNAGQWGVSGLPAHDIYNSAYIFGDHDAKTIPGIFGGVKTEDALGITKFTDLIENFAQTGTVKVSLIDGLPLGSLIWDDVQNAAYNSAVAYQKVKDAYVSTQVVSVFTDDFLDGVVAPFETGMPDLFGLSESGGVLNVAYHRTASSDSWGQFSFWPDFGIQPASPAVVKFKMKSDMAVTVNVKPIFGTTGDDWNTRSVPGDNAWHEYSCTLTEAKLAVSPVVRVYIYLDGGSTTPITAAVQLDDFYVGAAPVGVDGQSQQPRQFSLAQNYPNPFNPTTTINFTLAKASDVKLAVYNVLGQKVATLVDTRMNAGQQSVVFDASRLASGVYFYHLDAGSFNSVKKMLLMK